MEGCYPQSAEDVPQGSIGGTKAASDGRFGDETVRAWEPTHTRGIDQVRTARARMGCQARLMPHSFILFSSVL